MSRLFFFIGYLLAFGAMAYSATVTVNGTKVNVPVIEANGKAYGDLVALLALLGGKAVYNPATHTIAITMDQGMLANAELAGENGVFSKIYSIRKGSPIYFSITSAEYTTRQVMVGDSLIVPEANEKLLVIHFTVQNPQARDLLVRFDSLRFMAVDAMNVNHQGEGVWGDEQTKNPLQMSLKPKQKIAAYTVIKLPAAGVAPKLMVQSNLNDDGPVLRYDLRDVVAKLTPPIADPADATGATALLKVPAALNDMYPYRDFIAGMEKFEFVTDKLGDNWSLDARKGERFFTATATVKNPTRTQRLLRFDTFRATVTSVDGEKFSLKGVTFASSGREVGQQIEPGQDLKVRLVFIIPKDVVPAKLSILQGSSRTYEYEVPR